MKTGREEKPTPSQYGALALMQMNTQSSVSRLLGTSAVAASQAVPYASGGGYRSGYSSNVMRNSLNMRDSSYQGR